jgi:hypothetical protein
MKIIHPEWVGCMKALRELVVGFPNSSWENEVSEGG